MVGVALISLCNNDWALEEVYLGQSSVWWVIEELKKGELKKGELKKGELKKGGLSFGGIEHFIRGDQRSDYERYNFYGLRVIKQGTVLEFLEECVDIFEGFRDILLIYSDCPMVSVGLMEELLELHREELAEYSFMENYPGGFGVEVVSYELLERILGFKDILGGVFERGSVWEVINRDVNGYDVEVLTASRDVRQERLSLVGNSYEGVGVIRNAFERKGGKPLLRDVYDLIDREPEFMRVGVGYVEVEVTNECNCRCEICPRTHLMDRGIGYMDLERYKGLILDLKGLSEEFVMSLGYMGEPMLHPDLMGMIDFANGLGGIRVILETNGLYLDRRNVDLLSEREVEVIVALDSPDAELYHELRSVDELGVVEENVLYLLEKMRGKVYIQILQMEENEGYLDRFYRKWIGYKDRIIINKYNSYKGGLKDRSAINLEPLKRFPCYHLKRDLVILVDGRVAFCKQDISGEKSLGNAFEDSIKVLWDRLENYYIKDHQGYIDEFCRDCDEWHTYNF